jgi:FkbM family methyltransferase
MTGSALRSIYNWGPIAWFTTTTGLDFYIRKCYNYIKEIQEGTTNLSISDVSVEVSNRTIPDDVYLQAEQQVLEDLISEVQSDDVFWDVGAANGLYTCLIYITLGENVISFEPHPIRRGELKRNLQRNEISATIRTEALSDIEGEAEIGYSIDPDRKTGTFRATLVRGDRLIKQEYVEPPTIIKIDVEGAELDVLRGLDKHIKTKSCRLIYIELHNEISDFGATRQELEDYLYDCNFTIETITKRRVDEDFEHPHIKAKKSE